MLTLTKPDDWHVHLRDDEALSTTVPHITRQFARAIVMPNLPKPVATIEDAKHYLERIQAHIYPQQMVFRVGAEHSKRKSVYKIHDCVEICEGNNPEESSMLSTHEFKPLMTLYLTQETTPETILAAKQSGFIYAIKWYPKGATTHSNFGVTDIHTKLECLQAMVEANIPLLIHGEVTEPNIDIFDREKIFLEHILKPLMKKLPKLKIVLEHISTKVSVEFVQSASDNLAATITAHHLMLNRNDLLSGGLRPHHYCLPVLKRRSDQQALIQAATSGDPKFFLGTDSAPHAKNQKESSCGCAGIYTAPNAMNLYTQVFEQHDALHRLEGFASFYGPDFYQLPRNKTTITLIKKPYTIPNTYTWPNGHVIPMMAGGTLNWQLES